MATAKSRERKCSTCKHYQASPLWRKGWCRNPLLYDRNTNHLVEADSLACNRTFIDYWEPLDERATQASEVRSTGTTGAKPRVAPSINMETINAAGTHVSAQERTPVVDATAPMRSRNPLFKPLTSKEQPRAPLSIVNEGYDELDAPIPDPKSTQKMSQITRQKPGSPNLSARDRIQQAHGGRRSVLSQFSGPKLWIALGVLALLIVAVAVALLLSRKPTTNPPSSAILPGGPSTPFVLPTPTGLGDASPTSKTVATAPNVAVVPTAIAIGGYVKIVNTGDGLILRHDPTTSGARVTKLADGTKLHIIDGPQTANGFTWWKVGGFNPQSPDSQGWCVGKYLVTTSAP